MQDVAGYRPEVDATRLLQWMQPAGPLIAFHQVVTADSQYPVEAEIVGRIEQRLLDWEIGRQEGRGTKHCFSDSGKLL
jgi:hypothetical protein